MNEHVVTIFPTDTDHRLRGSQLSTFLERVSRHFVALGHGAEAQLRAGACSAEARSWASLVVAIDVARRACQGTEDLCIDLRGPARDRLARYLGTRRLHVRFEAFVAPRSVEGRSDRPVFWWLQLRGPGPEGVGERLVTEDKGLARTAFFEALEGAARTQLCESQAWV